MNKRILAILMTLAMLISVVPMAAMAAEEHECDYHGVSNGNGTHYLACDCGAKVDFTFNCSDYDGDGNCDSCGYQKYPTHTCTMNELISISATQHQYKCTCGLMVGPAMNHADGNGDGKCDSCSYGMYTAPETGHEHNYVAHSNNNGTHLLTCNCGLEIKDVTCLDNNGDGKCDACGYQKYNDDGNTHEHNYIAHSNNDGTHYLTCNCGLEVKDVTCLDNNGDGKCDSCGYQKYAPVCDHGFQYVSDNGDGKTHKATCRDCGVVIAERLEHVFNEYGVCACGAIQSSGCAHNGEQKVVDNKDGKTHKVICEECDEVIAEKAEHDYSATTGKCACGARKPHNDAGKNPNLDNVPKTGSNGTVITLCSFLLMGAMGIVACVKTDKKYI